MEYPITTLKAASDNARRSKHTFLVVLIGAITLFLAQEVVRSIAPASKASLPAFVSGVVDLLPAAAIVSAVVPCLFGIRFAFYAYQLRSLRKMLTGSV
jgi:branched-subunit amino acid transport protein AzlD